MKGSGSVNLLGYKVGQGEENEEEEVVERKVSVAEMLRQPPKESKKAKAEKK
jgi:hypothetical protein